MCSKLFRKPKRQRTEPKNRYIDQIKEHLSSLMTVSPNQDLSGEEDSKDHDNSCSLCGFSELQLAPEPKYCSYCGVIIKPKANYRHTTNKDKEQQQQHCFCCSCFKNIRKEVTLSNGQCIEKKTLCLAKNVGEIFEGWVQCDTCKEWNHKICGLYCGSDSSEDEYKCPKCWLKEMESGDQNQSCLNDLVIRSAKDLQQTALGNHIEERLLRRLHEDREERAKAVGKSSDQVPGAEDLSVRVVHSVPNKSEVNPYFLDALQNTNYPKEFPYTTKMIMLFQKIGGIDVCLFAMFVQEYGSDCGQPTQRHVCISYLDSVNYFTPGTRASTREALRTFAYHEVLIGYLDYVKRRGFTRCYLWACPPLKGDQYIFNSHPDSQKTPKSDRLRKWYYNMLKKASNEGIVVNRSNLYELFMIQKEDFNRKITAARLPYFEGDYWPGLVEKFLREIQISADQSLARKIGKKNLVTKTSLKVLGIANPADAASKDTLLMQKLGQAILPSKDDFMMVDLQYFCYHCDEPILTGKRWLCNDRKKSYLCQRCYDLKDNSSGDQDLLSKVEHVGEVPIDTKDVDGIINHEICESRYKFLKFCQDKYFQFNTLRRAKYSSLMILHHLSPPTVRSTVTLPECLRVKAMDVLNHLKQCTSNKESNCKDPDCSALRAMFCHAMKCKIKASGGCVVCQKVWCVLQSHSDQCTEPNCRMPYCGNLKRRRK